MKKLMTSVAALAAAAGMAEAGGVDRSGQSIGIIFEKGNYVELSYGVINPNVSGTDVASRPTGSVADKHTLPGLALNYKFNDNFSAALIYEHAYGADINYPMGQSILLGGTSAVLDSEVITGILRYKFDENWSVHGGIRASKASGEVTLSGLAYDPQGPANLSGYNVSFDPAWGTGYLVGAAYERPDIALRVALTYFSKVTHDLDTVETFASPLGPIPAGVPLASVLSVDTPQAVNLDFQSGVAKDTLVFGTIRWVDWSNFLIDPATFTAATGGGLVSLEDSTTYTLGVGRKFSDNWSGSVFATYEAGGDPLVSPLAPTNGYKGIGVAAVYTQDNMKVTMGVRYLKLGDAQPETGTPDVARANMTDNDAVAVGVRVGFSF
ncbi:OmpP1/FadL family transporter [Pseudogemmobacter blasticus]|uniref:Aromatic hydrocarbon degradation protein n=1 Tax=Fuscovulum blasticum DSM 2131 TaxID=1188250 RepID=A0A2T4JAZ6_FUSBL|nr:outer membrane protein transport protein [Fuscovulum blasticum]AWD20495.1 aromatic hydrocarbon degradation protein [Fuscovulum blasticum]PTE15061.1 aromatic hydrocarbon degradation protein [Fuscovulum blasticum DSM 2131]